MLPNSLPHLPLLKAFEHNPFSQRHRVGYDANDHVASTPSVPLPGYDTTFCGVPGVPQELPRHMRYLSQEGREGRLGRLLSIG